jgi:hypothetical protein
MGFHGWSARNVFSLPVMSPCSLTGITESSKVLEMVKFQVADEQMCVFSGNVVLVFNHKFFIQVNAK